MTWYFRDGTRYKGGGNFKLTGEGKAKVSMAPVNAKGTRGAPKDHRLYTAKVLNKMNWRAKEVGLRLKGISSSGLKTFKGSDGREYRTYESIPDVYAERSREPHYIWSRAEVGPKNIIRKLKAKE